MQSRDYAEPTLNKSKLSRQRFSAGEGHYFSIKRSFYARCGKKLNEYEKTSHLNTIWRKK